MDVENRNTNEIDTILADPRFSHVYEDPRFKNAPAAERKVKLDERFESILKNELFSEKACMDPRGRPRNFGCKENFNKFYEMDSSADSSNNDDSLNGELPKPKKKPLSQRRKCETNKTKKKISEKSTDDDSESESETNTGSSPLKKNINKKLGKKIVKDKNVELKTHNNSKIVKQKSEKVKIRKVHKLVNEKSADSVSISNIKKCRVENNTISEDKQSVMKSEIDSQAIPEALLERLLDMDHDVTRGACLFSDDSSDDDSSTTDEDDGEALGEFEWGELDHDAQWDCDGDIEETSRFAVCNMDFDQVKAVDLLVLFSSFAPVVGKVLKVTVYLSEFGKQRLAEEDDIGPPELAKLGVTKEDADSDLKYLDKIAKGTLEETTRPTPKHVEALRRYQRNRLKYYYAVVECDSVSTSKVIYKECDRMPYEVGGVSLDLRYIPDDMKFDTEVVHDSCEKSPSSYVSQVFQTTALLDSNPTLTWDETDRSRQAALSSAMTSALKKQSYDFEKLQRFVANSSSEEEDEENDGSDEDKSSKSVKEERLAKFRAVINELNNKENRKTNLEIDMEETFEVNDQPAVDEDIETKNDSISSKLTPFENFLEKRKKKRKEKNKVNENAEVQFSDDELPEAAKNISSDPFFSSETSNKKKNKRGKKKSSEKLLMPTKETDAELNLMLMEEEEENAKHFNMRAIIEADTGKDKKKRKNKKKNKNDDDNNVEDFQIDLSDPRFAAVSKSRDFNIDPSHPQFVPTKAMSALAKQVQKTHRADDDLVNQQQTQKKRTRLSDDVSLLVKKFKSKNKNVL